MEGEATGACLRCGAPYGPDDTVCYTCGAPIGETRANTQPVKAVRTATASPAPTQATAKPAPASIPAPSSQASAATTATPSSAPAEPRPRLRRRWIVVVAACLVIVAALTGAAFALRALNTPPPAAHHTRYTDPQGRFSFEQPALWHIAQVPGGVALSDSSSISTATITVDDSQAGVGAQAAADAKAARDGLSPAPAQQVGGETWQVRSGQPHGQDGVTREDVLLVTVHAGTLYTIEFVCPIASYDTTNSLVYQPLLTSFTFSGANS